MPRTFRLFISSTFNDLKEERNALQQSVFPQLRDLCQSYGYRFQAIDLRWGISAEASLNQKTMRICLEELRRCQEITPSPNFLILLGNRYGWQPLPEILSDEDYNTLINSNIDNNEAALVQQWYKIDENAVPVCFELQAREGIYVDFAEWVKVEAALRTVLSKHATLKEIIEKSATEHEILKGVLEVKNASEHVLCFNREFEFEKPLEQIVIEEPENAGVYFDLKTENNQLVPNAIMQQQLANLKQKISNTIPENIFTYKLKWGNNCISGEYLRKFCDDVYSSLSKIISAEIEKEQSVGQNSFEIQQHTNFIEAHFNDIKGRESEIQKVRNYIENSHSRLPFVIIGESGSGKSSFLMKSIKDSLRNYPTENYIYRFIGLTPNSLNSEKLLLSMIQELADIFKVQVKAKSHSLSVLQLEFYRLLEMAVSTKTQLIIYVDALDRLTGYGNRIPAWLPVHLPLGVKLIISATHQCIDNEFDLKIPKENRLELCKLTSNIAENIIENLLGKRQRKLQKHQQDIILANFEQSGLPLYLSLAVGEAMHWKSHQHDVSLKSSVNGLINQVINRLSSAEMHGEALVSKVLMLLAASKTGLSEDELLDLLALDSDFMDELQRHHKIPIKKLPVALWARLYMDLEPYLLSRSADGSEVYDFNHQAFKNVVLERYFSNPEVLFKVRNMMIQYYNQQNWNITKCESTVYGRLSNARKTSELVYQLKCNENLELLFNCLTDPNFIEAKCVGQGVDELLNDYDFLDLNKEKLNDPEKFRQFYGFVVKESDVLRQYPELTMQQALNQDKFKLVKADFELRFLGKMRNSFLKLNENQRDQNPFLWRFSSVGSEIVKFAVSPNKPVIAAISQSGNLLFFDASNGRITSSIPLGSNSLNDCCFSGNGEVIAILESNANISFYSYPDLQLVETRLTSHFAERIVLDTSGKLVAVWSGPELSVISSKSETIKLSGHFKKINNVKFSDGVNSLISVSNDYSICEWNLSVGNVIWQSDTHHDQVYDVDCTPCRKYMVTSSVDEIIIWDKNQHCVIERIKVPSCCIKSISIKPFDKGMYQILATGDDAVIRVYHAKEVNQNSLSVFEPIVFKPGTVPLAFSSFIACFDDLFFIETENKLVYAIKLQASKKGEDEIVKKDDFGAITVIRRHPENGAIVWGTTGGFLEHVDREGQYDYLRIHSDYVTDMVYSKEESTFFTSGGDKNISKISSSLHGSESLYSKAIHKKTVRCIALINNGEFIASADDSGLINIIANEEEVYESVSTGKSYPILSMVQPNESPYLLAMDKSNFYFINLALKDEVKSIAHHVDLAMKFILCGEIIYVVNRKGCIFSFNLDIENREINSAKKHIQQSDQCNDMSVLNSSFLALAMQSGVVEIFRLPNIEPVGLFSVGEPVTAIDTFGEKEIVAGTISCKYVELELEMPELASKN